MPRKTYHLTFENIGNIDRYAYATRKGKSEIVNKILAAYFKTKKRVKK